MKEHETQRSMEMNIPDSVPHSLEVVLSRHQNQVESVDDERETGDGYWIYLKDGWIFDSSTTFIHESSVKTVIQAFKLVRWTG